MTDATADKDEMKMTNQHVHWVTTAALAILLSSMARPAHASVITFDTLAATNNFVGGSVAGFEIAPDNGAIGAGVFEGTFGLGTFWGAAVSGANIVTNYNTHVGQISRSAPFDFTGAYFNPGISAPDIVAFAGLDAADHVLFTQTVALDPDWQFLTFNWQGISKFRWDPVGNQNIGLDNFTYNVPTDVTVVPEPSSLWLLGSGVVAAACIKRRKYRLRVGRSA